MEKLQQQLLLIQDKKKKGTNLQEVELRRNHIKQQEQLDELRKQQHQLKTERDQWQKTSERFQKSMSAEKEELEREKAKIQQEKMENDRQRDEIQRAKEEYQREMGRLRDIKRRTQHLDIHTSQSTSSLSSSSSATVNRNNSNNGPDLTELRLSTGDGKAVPMSKAHSSLHSSSTDLGSKAPPSPTYISASDYPRTFPGPKQASGAVSAPTAPQLPIHLKYSATNQLAALQAPRHQEFPSKLSKLASSTKGKPVSSSGDSKSSLMHQMIPSKLTKLASGQSGHHVSSKRLHIV
uniref:Uncharacterized protein n=1 Tax=Ciona savignyi TaxID=51511 RepID=H2YLD9_CIOSA